MATAGREATPPAQHGRPRWWRLCRIATALRSPQTSSTLALTAGLWRSRVSTQHGGEPRGGPDAAKRTTCAGALASRCRRVSRAPGAQTPRCWNAIMLCYYGSYLSVLAAFFFFYVPPPPLSQAWSSSRSCRCPALRRSRCCARRRCLPSSRRLTTASGGAQPLLSVRS